MASSSSSRITPVFQINQNQMEFCKVLLAICEVDLDENQFITAVNDIGCDRAEFLGDRLLNLQIARNMSNNTDYDFKITHVLFGQATSNMLYNNWAKTLVDNPETKFSDYLEITTWIIHLHKGDTFQLGKWISDFAFEQYESQKIKINPDKFHQRMAERKKSLTSQTGLVSWKSVVMEWQALKGWVHFSESEETSGGYRVKLFFGHKIDGEMPRYKDCSEAFYHEDFDQEKMLGNAYQSFCRTKAVDEEDEDMIKVMKRKGLM